MAKKQLEQLILDSLEKEDLRVADLVRAHIQTASPLTIHRYVSKMAKDGKIYQTESMKWRIKK